MLVKSCTPFILIVQKDTLTIGVSMVDAWQNFVLALFCDVRIGGIFGS